jgi:hypothetical protein
MAPLTTPFEDQIFLSQSLQLLSLLKHNAPSTLARRCTTQNVAKPTQQIVEMLDTIALLLTIHHRDVVVAAFGRHTQLSLVLAIAHSRHENWTDNLNTHEQPTSAHHAALHDFTSLLTNPNIHSVDDVFPHITKHCGTNMERCIRKLHDSVSTFASTLDLDLDLDLDSTGAGGVLASYVPVCSLELEFPDSNVWIAEHYANIDADADSKSTFLTIFSDLLSILSDLSSPSSRSISSTIQYKSHYHALTIVANILRHSRFLNTLVDAYALSAASAPRGQASRNASNSSSISKIRTHAQADKLKRRLQNVCRYDQGVDTLLRQAKRVFPPYALIPVRWVVSGSDGSGRGIDVMDTADSDEFEICATPLDALLAVPSSSPDPLDPTTDTDTDSNPDFSPNSTLLHFLHTTHPSLFTDWKSHIRVHVHPEIRVALHLTGHSSYSTNPATSSSSSSSAAASSTPMPTPNPQQATPFLPLGSTKPPCLGCSLWCSAFMDARCVFSRHTTSGKAKKDWGVPREESAGVVGGLGAVRTKTGAGAGEGTGRVSIAAMRMRALRGTVREEVRKEVRGVLVGLGGDSGAGVDDGYGTETETDVSMGSESEEEQDQM